MKLLFDELLNCTVSESALLLGDPLHRGRIAKAVSYQLQTKGEGKAVQYLMVDGNINTARENIIEAEKGLAKMNTPVHTPVLNFMLHEAIVSAAIVDGMTGGGKARVLSEALNNIALKRHQLVGEIIDQCQQPIREALQNVDAPIPDLNDINQQLMKTLSRDIQATRIENARPLDTKFVAFYVPLAAMAIKQKLTVMDPVDLRSLWS